jgi:hypothetical protein
LLAETDIAPSSGNPTSDPPLDRARQAALSQVGLVVGAQAAPEREAVIRVQRECEQPDHHAIVRFGWVSRDRQRVVTVIAVVDVGNGKLGFKD